MRSTPRAKAIFLNSPHNPTGGVASAADLREIANLIRGRNVAVFSDEPYCHMVWEGRHQPLLAEPGIMDQVVAAYTFSKSYSMSGWRLGYAISSPKTVELLGKMINTSLSCVTPIAQWAGQAALEHDAGERDEVMQRFKKKVQLLVEDLRRVEDVKVLMPVGTFYVFPEVSAICRRLGIRSHGLAMYLLEAADDRLGVACLGGECFGPAGQGFLRFTARNRTSAAPGGRLPCGSRDTDRPRGPVPGRQPQVCLEVSPLPCSRLIHRRILGPATLPYLAQGCGGNRHAERRLWNTGKDLPNESRQMQLLEPDELSLAVLASSDNEPAAQRADVLQSFDHARFAVAVVPRRHQTLGGVSANDEGSARKQRRFLLECRCRA